MLSLLGLCFWLCVLWSEKGLGETDTDPRSPLHSHLPDCLSLSRSSASTSSSTSTSASVSVSAIPRKRTSWRGVLCPMVKDEQGFLSEWLAYYELHGFERVVLFDNNSTSPLTEIEPWLKTGFVQVVPDGWADEPWLFKNPKKKFTDMMHVKYRSEAICKERAVAMGFDVFLSVDTDEYVIPNDPNVTLMDELAEWFTKTSRGVMIMNKFQYNAVPHFMEPINLLTIEAYTTRTRSPGQMSYYLNVAGKVGLQLNPRNNVEYTNDTVQYLIHCCDFHGCNNMNANRQVCQPLHEKGVRWQIEGKHKKWFPPPRINHYARSLEKFMSKQKTWQTASGSSAHGYNINHYMERTFGYFFDDVAVKYGCQVRELLRNRTGEADYLRPGDWYRNPEFGRTVEDPSKRGRNGGGYGKYLPPQDMNPYPIGETYQRAHKPYTKPK